MYRQEKAAPPRQAMKSLRRWYAHAKQFPFYYIDWVQMLFAFRRGVELLGAPESGPAQIQGNPMENYGKSVSQHMEAAGGVPKNVTQLKPAIDNLLYKVITITL